MSLPVFQNVKQHFFFFKKLGKPSYASLHFNRYNIFTDCVYRYLLIWRLTVWKKPYVKFVFQFSYLFSSISKLWCWWRHLTTSRFSRRPRKRSMSLLKQQDLETMCGAVHIRNRTYLVWMTVGFIIKIYPASPVHVGIYFVYSVDQDKMHVHFCAVWSCSALCCSISLNASAFDCDNFKMLFFWN